MIQNSQIKRASVLLAVLTLAAWFLFQVLEQDGPRQSGVRVSLQSMAPKSDDGMSSTAAVGHDTNLDVAETVDFQQLNRALKDLKATSSADDARRILSELRAALDSLPPARAAALITQFLANPSDNAATRIDFAIGEGGLLDGQPSLRVALLDWLGQIDPLQAGVVASQILTTPGDADEWAVSLRNYARAYPTPDSHAFLRAKTEELIRNPVWREKPSIGFLESFDVLVHTRASSSSGLLSELVADRSPQGKPLAYASFLTLDRLTLRDPVAMLEQLSTHPELSQTRGEMVANLFARADLRDAAQQRLVRKYLLDPSRSNGELAAFAGIYPNANFMVSKNLLSENITFTGDEITARDTAALAVVDNWLSDPEFERIRSHLTTIHQRLATFAGKSSK